jgi:hypothetical protein
MYLYRGRIAKPLSEIPMIFEHGDLQIPSRDLLNPLPSKIPQGFVKIL